MMNAYDKYSKVETNNYGQNDYAAVCGDRPKTAAPQVHCCMIQELSDIYRTMLEMTNIVASIEGKFIGDQPCRDTGGVGKGDVPSIPETMTMIKRQGEDIACRLDTINSWL